MGESNETGVSICQAKDIYPNYVEVKICDAMITEYDIIGKQLFRLREAWSNFSNGSNKRKITNAEEHQNQTTTTQTGSPDQQP